ncbi:hypothetical protein BV898_11083 [Hypsibius exemplaris]|uniref:Uncharacterized protein n=1 Tax=Hypsibius exemplaris TaxID=2072580 RepID=A0A1W0WHM8_HYPEX|nr:hypothetical protein BV898_11083 [Hypsibius exemplaris]
MVVGGAAAPSPAGGSAASAPPSAVKLCPDFMKCVAHCGVLTDCHMVTCCSAAPGSPAVPACLNHVRYCGAPTVKNTQKCRKSSDCVRNPVGGSHPLCCLNPGSSNSQDGFCADIPCSLLCASIVPGYQPAA